MEQIFDSFLEKEISGDTLIKAEYASIHRVKISWVRDPKGLTIQQWVNEVCGLLEEEGHDLQQTHTDEVMKKFITYDISVETPEEYLQLIAAMEMSEKNLQNLIEFKAPDSMISQAKEGIKLLVLKMKELS